MLAINYIITCSRSKEVFGECKSLSCKEFSFGGYLHYIVDGVKSKEQGRRVSEIASLKKIVKARKPIKKITALYDEGEVNALIHLLKSQGVCYLWGNDPTPYDEETISPVELLQRLASCNFPIVEYAAISLLLLHPELASAVETALKESTPEVAEEIAVVTLATLYLQEWWIFPLAIAFGRLPAFPEAPFMALWEDRKLPSPSSGYGRDGFLALQDYQQEQYGLPINFLDDWQNQIDHLLNQEEAHLRQPSAQLMTALAQKFGIHRGNNS